MSLSIDRFGEYFQELWKHAPFPWQTRLAKLVFEQGWPACIDLPTASGKTATIDIAVFVLACQASRPTCERTVGRRIFFTVNRRVIVDEACERASQLAETLSKADDGILKEVADALRQVSGGNGPPLEIAQLRGGIYRDHAWARSITQPIVVCTTADQLGSRLLFRGYGISSSSAPVHAALCGCDALILLDEAHVTRAFTQTMQRIARYQSARASTDTPIPPLHFVQMTATPADGVTERFSLDAADGSHPVLKSRLEVSKPAALVKLDKKKPVADEIVARAFDAISDTRKAVGIIVNRVQTARDIEQQLRAQIAKRSKQDETFSADVHLVIGRMRPLDRDALQESLRNVVGPARPPQFAPHDKPVFVVATQCLEVGADYDFDVLLTECASIDALRQRFGRLNRKGRPVETMAAIVTNEESLKGEDPIYGDAIKHTWEWLWSKKDKQGHVDFGIASFKPLWDAVEREHKTHLDRDCPKPLLSPASDAAVLLPAHLDTLCQTWPRPEPSPDVKYFIHGPQQENAEVNVCWRADLVANDLAADVRWPEAVRMLPPTSPECMTVPLITVKRWMGEKYKTFADADVAVQEPELENRRNGDRNGESPRVVIWRFEHSTKTDGKKKPRMIGFVSDNPRDLRVGDTIVMPVASRSWQELGHIPGATEANYEKLSGESEPDYQARCARIDSSVDIAELATRRSRLRLAFRLHDALPGRAELRGLPAPELRDNLRSLLEETISDPDELKRTVEVVSSGIERHRYEAATEDAPDQKFNELVTFKRLIKPPPRLKEPAICEDDGEDDLSESNQFILLDEHVARVVKRLSESVVKLSLNSVEASLVAAARQHDRGKIDARFQAMLAGITPYEAMLRRVPLGKGDGIRRTYAERQAIMDRAQYPRYFRHEMLSVDLVEHLHLEPEVPHRALFLHLIEAHHGYARPFAPVCKSDVPDELLTVCVDGREIVGEIRKAWTPCYRLDSGVAHRFWNLTREHGWWGLAWLESILRLADQQASAEEQGK